MLIFIKKAEKRLLSSSEPYGSWRPNHQNHVVSHASNFHCIVDIKLVSFPHTDAMVINVYIDKWDVTRVLVDNDNQAEILFLLAFDQMG
jgi:hypothetical protein